MVHKIINHKLIGKNFFEKKIYEDVSNYKRKSKKKITMENFVIPKFKNYNDIIELNYNVKQLRIVCCNYGLKKSGCKADLKYRAFNYLKYSYYANIIQRFLWGSVVRKLYKLRGPGFKKRNCVNETDFLMFEKVKNIENNQFYSFKDKDGFIYGFNICSLYNLFVENKGDVLNPYNRNKLNPETHTNIIQIIGLSKILNMKTNIIVVNDTDSLSFKKKVELKCIDTLQILDGLGHITDPSWFYNLSRPKLLKFIRELMDIWNYRLNLTVQLKKKICFPHGKPFLLLNLNSLFKNEDINKIKNGLLNVIKKFVTLGIDNQHKALGAYYILGALTIVSRDAAISLPWLYETFRT